MSISQFWSDNISCDTLVCHVAIPAPPLYDEDFLLAQLVNQQQRHISDLFYALLTLSPSDAFTDMAEYSVNATARDQRDRVWLVLIFIQSILESPLVNFDGGSDTL